MNAQTTHRLLLQLLLAAAVVLTALGVLAATAAVPALADRSPQVTPVPVWQHRYAPAVPAQHAQARALARSGNSWAYYGLAYALDAEITMYQATGHLRHLDRALGYAETMTREARPSGQVPGPYRDSYRGWASSGHPYGANGTEVPLFESYAYRYVARMLRVMHDSDLPDRYTPRYRALLRFVGHNVVDKWMDRGMSNIYRENAHMAAHWATICMHVAALTHSEERRDRCRTTVRRIDRMLHEEMTVRDGAYFWTLSWDSQSGPGADVAHANGVVAYLVDAYHYGNPRWQRRDMLRLVDTLHQVWPRHAPASGYLDGSGQGTGWYSDGFVELGRFSPSLQDRLLHHTPAGAQFDATMALNARLINTRVRQHPRMDAWSVPSRWAYPTWDHDPHPVKGLPGAK